MIFYALYHIEAIFSKEKESSTSMRFRSFLRKVFMNTSPKWFMMVEYRRKFGRFPNLKNPTDFNQKIIWLMLNWQHPLLVVCADKYRMRDYVESHGLGSILPELYGVWESADQINWDSLPNQFVIKCNHGCHMNIICKDKVSLDRVAAGEELQMWLNTKFGGEKNYEPHYTHIKPVILAEKYIKSADGKAPPDYKIYCFNGEPELILVCLERETHLLLEFYDLDWNVLEIGAEKNQRKAKRPASLDKMIDYARELSKPFPFVRVDFYDRDGEAILGEFTFTPNAGIASYYTEAGNVWLGSKLKLPEKYSGHFT